MAFNNSEKQVKSKGGEHLDYLSGLTNWSNSLSFHNEVEEYLAVSIESQSVNPCEWWNTISNFSKDSS
ncbi:15445_t:CDS:2 [Rhizophagus irregularis]|nr:15445_t:CDS:2 [Rhizophagus irregularis]